MRGTGIPTERGCEEAGVVADSEAWTNGDGKELAESY